MTLAKNNTSTHTTPTMSDQIIFITLPTFCIAALSSYTAYYSYISITDVQTYEEQTKKAAEYSNIAEDALRQTRTTEGAGAVAVSHEHHATILRARWKGLCHFWPLQRCDLSCSAGIVSPSKCRLTLPVDFPLPCDRSDIHCPHHSHFLYHGPTTLTNNDLRVERRQCRSMSGSTSTHQQLLARQGQDTDGEELQRGYQHDEGCC